MIVPMEKVTLLCLAGDRDAMLRALRRLGVMHVTPVRAPDGAALDSARKRLGSIERALDFIPPPVAEGGEERDVEDLLQGITKLQQERVRLQEKLTGLQHQRHAQEPYGSFDPDLVRQLAAEGVSVRLYQVSGGHEPALPEGAVRVDLGGDRATRYFAVVARGEPKIDANEFPLPEHSLQDVEAEINQVRARLAENEAAREGYGVYAAHLARAASEARDEAHFHEVGAGMGASSDLTYLQGYCPAQSVERISRAAAEHGWGILAEAPGPEDQIPTLIRHPNWVKPIKVVLDFIGVLPGYDEVDISALFLLFFSIFFAMIVGDAGYGAIFLALTFAGRRWLPKAPPHLWRLMFVMSIGTIVWGLLSGNFFGIINLPAPLAGLKIDWLGDDNNVMWLCFLLGAIHLTIAHGWNLFRTINTPQALAQAGWIVSTWYMFFWARTMVLGRPFPMFMHAVFAVGALLIVVFMTPFRRIKSQWFDHVVLPLNLVSNFVDVVSYVRLFAVGMATFAVASAFNEMALGGGVDGLVAGLVAGFIIFFGHTLNIMLAMMGVLVHGVRLNTLEFSGHMGLTWSGSKFTPFAAGSGEDGAEG